MWPPRHFYVDDERTCIQCLEVFVFSAQEQRFWYEDLGFTFDSKPIRCVACRRDRRTDRRRADAVTVARGRPDDAQAQLELAAAIVEHVAAYAEGNADTAIYAARRARQLQPELQIAYYWEARAQELAGRAGKAVELFDRFLEAAGRSTQRSSQARLSDATRRRTALRATPRADPVAPAPPSVGTEGSDKSR